jgi:low temperature requirement protein LtrA
MSSLARLRSLTVPMQGRSPEEANRVATPLELFFDLVFVVAIAQAGASLSHGLVTGDIGQTIIRYIFVFGGIWWAWMNFTWFASAYDTDDVVYRLITFVQLAGALVLAAGVPRAFEQNDWRIGLAGYVIMRLALVTQWLRVYRDDPQRRPGAWRYAAGITAVQIAWVVLILSSPSWFMAGFLALFLVELAIPVWAERAARTPYHPEHISERYGLFTIIVLGEAMLSASLAVRFIADDGLSPQLVGILLGGMLIVFTMWWLYFERPPGSVLSSLRQGFVWGYGHLPVWAAAAAVGSGLAVAIEQASELAVLDAVQAGYIVAVPVAIYLIGLGLLRARPMTLRWADAVPVVLTIGAILLAPLTGWGVLLTGLILAALLGFKLATGRLPSQHRVTEE